MTAIEIEYYNISSHYMRMMFFSNKTKNEENTNTHSRSSTQQDFHITHTHQILKIFNHLYYTQHWYNF